MASFAPRILFPNLDSLPRSWFLGHHRAGLNKMKTMLSSIDLIIECRDCRVPITSRNPLFEEHLAGRRRLIVYTKQDLAGKAFDSKVRGLHEMSMFYLGDAEIISLIEQRNIEKMAQSIFGPLFRLSRPKVGSKSSRIRSKSGNIYR